MKRSEKKDNWKRTTKYRPAGLSQKEVAEKMGISIHEVQIAEKQALRKLWQGLRDDDEVRSHAETELLIDTDDREIWLEGDQAIFVPGVQLGLIFNTDEEQIQ